MDEYYECVDCYYFRYYEERWNPDGEGYCRRTCMDVFEDSSACDCFMKTSDWD